jgi:hypothetical protein
VDKKYSSFPVLATITPDKIRVTAAAARHIATIFIKRLYDLNMDAGSLNPDLERNVVNEIRKAVPRGIVLFNNAADDTHNPLDRQIEVYTYIQLNEIDRALEGIAKLRVACRLSLYNGTLSLRTIERNFSAE